MKNTYLQISQMITGALVAVLLAIHLVVQQSDVLLGLLGIKVADPTTWASMMERAHQGSWVGIYIALLAFGLFHALNGFRNILLETNLSASAMRVLTGFIIAFGVIFLVLGTYAPIALFNSYR
jgi:succinate dehydrogenase / fumarate reductase, membrane anchor subunit